MWHVEFFAPKCGIKPPRMMLGAFGSYDSARRFLRRLKRRKAVDPYLFYRAVGFTEGFWVVHKDHERLVLRNANDEMIVVPR